MSRSSGFPGSMRFWMPSMAAMSMAEKVKYGFELGSGQRNSNRFALGSWVYMGMRTDAERLRCDITRLTGASNPGTRRRYEFVVGAAKARIAGAWFRMPPIAWSAVSDNPA